MKRQHWWTIALIVWSGLGTPGRAQVNTVDAASTPTEPEKLLFDDLNVTANRRSTPRSKTPASVIVKTKSEIEKELPLARTAADILQTAPGVTLNRLGLLSSSPNIRGLSGERIQVLVDGERLPNAEFGPDLGTVDPFRFERIEVLKGPASSIYGADAFGGAINIITSIPEPEATPEIKWAAFAGGFAEGSTAIEARGPGYVLGVTARTAGDAVDGEGAFIPPQGTAYSVFDSYLTTRIDLNAQDRLEVRLDRYRQSYADLNFPEPFTAGQNFFRNRDRYSLGYILGGDDLRANLKVFYQKLERKFNAAQVIDTGFFILESINSTRSNTETWGISANTDFAWGPALFTVGYDFSKDTNTSVFDDATGNNFSPIVVESTSISPLSARTFNGVFIQSSLALTSQLDLSTGIRWDSYDNRDDQGLINNTNAVTFNLGSTYRFSEGWVLRANFGQGFRPPSLLYLFGSGGSEFIAPGFGFVTSDPELRPERANNLDLGLSYSTGTVNLELGVYRNQITDFQGFSLPALSFDDAGDAGSPFRPFSLVNKNVTLQGIEVGFTWLIDPAWRLEGNFSYLDGRDDQGQPLNSLEAAPLQALIRLGYEEGDWSASVQGRIYGEQTGILVPDLVEGFSIGSGTPPATVFDLNAAYQLTPQIQLTLSIENLLDTPYVYPTSTFAGPGARIIAGVKARF